MAFHFVTILALLAIHGASALQQNDDARQNNTNVSRRGLVNDITSGVTKYLGQGTYFYPGLGACGTHAGNSDAIVALNVVQYGE